MSITKKFPRRPRLPHLEYRGFKRYFLTINTFNQKPLFVNKKVYEFVLKFLFNLKKHQFDAWVFLFMPDHLHLLTEALNEACNLEKFVKEFKQLSGYYFKKEFKQSLWAVSYWDHILRKDEDIQGIVGYILYNPVKAHIIGDWIDYPYWGSTIFKREELYLSGLKT